MVPCCCVVPDEVLREVLGTDILKSGDQEFHELSRVALGLREAQEQFVRLGTWHLPQRSSHRTGCQRGTMPYRTRISSRRRTHGSAQKGFPFP